MQRIELQGQGSAKARDGTGGQVRRREACRQPVNGQTHSQAGGQASAQPGSFAHQ